MKVFLLILGTILVFAANVWAFLHLDVIMAITIYIASSVVTGIIIIKTSERDPNETTSNRSTH